MEIVEDRFVSGRGWLISDGHQAGKGAMYRTYRSSVCRSDSKIDIIKGSLAVNVCSGGVNLGRTVAMVEEGSYYYGVGSATSARWWLTCPSPQAPSITRRYSNPSLNTHTFCNVGSQREQLSTEVRGINFFKIFFRSSLLRVSPIPFPSVLSHETRLTALPRARLEDDPVQGSPLHED